MKFNKEKVTDWLSESNFMGVPKGAVLVFTTIGILLFIVLMAAGRANNKKEDMIIDKVTFGLEWAYMEGQRDYAEGDIRIEKSYGDWKWTVSPWDNGDVPAFETLSQYEEEM